MHTPWMLVQEILCFLAPNGDGSDGASALDAVLAPDEERGNALGSSGPRRIVRINSEFRAGSMLRNRSTTSRQHSVQLVEMPSPYARSTSDGSARAVMFSVPLSEDGGSTDTSEGEREDDELAYR